MFFNGTLEALHCILTSSRLAMATSRPLKAGIYYATFVTWGLSFECNMLHESEHYFD